MDYSLPGSSVRGILILVLKSVSFSNSWDSWDDDWDSSDWDWDSGSDWSGGGSDWDSDW